MLLRFPRRFLQNKKNVTRMPSTTTTAKAHGRTVFTVSKRMETDLESTSVVPIVYVADALADRPEAFTGTDTTVSPAGTSTAKRGPLGKLNPEPSTAITTFNG